MRSLVFHETDSDDVLAFSKSVPGNTVVGVIALRADRVCEGTVRWDASAWGGEPGSAVAGVDAFSGEPQVLAAPVSLAPTAPVVLVRLS
jgi:hypothetical protein